MIASSYPVGLCAPDIEPYRDGNCGVDFVTMLDSGRPGPHVLINALTHGNELCGAVALDYLFRENLRPLRGRLTLSFANIDAYRRFDPASPSYSRYVDEDFNRVWSEDVLDGPRDSVELRRARKLRPVVDSADFLLDIHSMHHPTTPLMMCGLTRRSMTLARRTGIPDWLIADAGHKAGRRLRDYGGFGDPASPKTALLVECGQHWRPASADVAIDVTLRFLLALGVIDGGFAGPRLRGSVPREQRAIEVTDAITIESDGFCFASDYRGLEVIEAAGTMIGKDGGRTVETPYADCVLVMPGIRLQRGDTAIRFGRIVG